MSDATWPHSPDIMKAAPGLLRSLRGVLSESELRSFCRAYQICIELGASHEGPIRRAEAEAFNPRPARICKILLRECRESRLPIFLGALLGSLNYNLSESLDRTLTNANFQSLLETEPSMQQALSLHKEWQDFMHTTHSALSEAAERIFLALLLDQLRHLHMSNLSTHEQTILCQTFAGYILRLTSSALNMRLQEVVHAALKRAALRLDCPEGFIQQEAC